MIHSALPWRSKFPTLGLLALVLALWASCGPRLDPRKMDDEILTIQDSLYSIGQDWGEAFQIGFMEGDYQGLRPIREQMQGFLDRSIARMERLEDRGGSEDYRQAFIDFLHFESSVVAPALRAFEELQGPESDSLAAQRFEALALIMEKEQAHLVKIYSYAEAYREKHKIPVKERPSTDASLPLDPSR